MSTVTRYHARLPNRPDQVVPAVFVSEATKHDYLNATTDDPDCSRLKTAIYYWSERGKDAAERIVADLRVTGVALVYPSDRDMRIYPGIKHQVIEIGARHG